MNNNNVDVKELQGYEKDFNENKLMNKITKYAKFAGGELLYMVNILWEILKDPAVPAMAKAPIIGSLGYFINPIDLIADGIPGIGLTDDTAALAAALGLVRMYATEAIKDKAILNTQKILKLTDEEATSVRNLLNRRGF